jgi:hypothetical protein
MADNISVSFYLSLGNKGFVIIPAEYLHIYFQISFSCMEKMGLLSSFNLPWAYTCWRLIRTWLIFEGMQYDKNALKDQPIDCRCYYYISLRH